MSTIHQKNLKELYEKALKAKEKDEIVWLNSRSMGKLLGMSRTWAHNLMINEEIKSIVNTKKGINKKYRLVHIDDLVAYLKKIYFEKDLS